MICLLKLSIKRMNVLGWSQPCKRFSWLIGEGVLLSDCCVRNTHRLHHVSLSGFWGEFYPKVNLHTTYSLWPDGIILRTSHYSLLKILKVNIFYKYFFKKLSPVIIRNSCHFLKFCDFRSTSSDKPKNISYNKSSKNGGNF